MQTDEPVRRPAEIEDPTNLLAIHPIASRLTGLFAALHIPPNAVSLAGMAFGVLAAAAYYHYQDVRYAVAGFVLMIAWHVMDGADGQLARLTHSQSQTGKVLDGICDYTTFIAVYVALAAALSRQSGDWVWALAAAAGLCHSAQSAAYEVQREDYSCFGLGRPWARLAAPAQAPRRSSAAPPTHAVLDTLHLLYVRLQLFTIGADAGPRERLAALLGSEPERAASIRARYRETFAPAVRRWSVLSSNYRTLGIFIGALLDAPQHYFEFEIVGFSAILAVLLLDQRARYRRFLRALEGAQ
ncbi:MAG: CDP-alcohol phosphatidyltransferase family protein [Steroidobacteraceae bacterium]